MEKLTILLVIKPGAPDVEEAKASEAREGKCIRLGDRFIGTGIGL